MKATERLLAATVVMLMAALLAVGCDRGTQSGSYPSKPIEFVVHAAPGGGSDIFARTMADIIAKNKLVPVSISVVNKSGGSSAMAKAYLAEKPGDPYFWMTATTSFQTSHITGGSPLGYKDFTPLGVFGEDTQAILVPADSKWKSFKELMDDAQKNPGKINWGGSSVGNDDHILMYRIQKATGVKFNYVSHKSGGEVMAAILGGHVDMASANPGEAAAQIEAKKLIPLAVASDKPVPSIPNVPMLKDLGVNVKHTQMRGLVAPKDIPKEAVAWLDGMFGKLVKTADWAKYLKDNDVIDTYAPSAEHAKLLEEEYKMLDGVLTEVGLKKELQK